MNENNMSTVAIAAINKTNNDITILLIFGMLILGCFLTNTKNN